MCTGVCMVPSWPGCLWGCCTRAPWSGPAEPHFIFHVLGTRRCCGISHCAVTWMGIEMSPGSSSVCRRVVSSAVPLVPRTNISVDKLLWAWRRVICAQGLE